MAFKKAFTIVELLVVIIVIAVLVSLALVGYSGISSKANIATLQSDLANAKKQLLSFQASSSTNSFPTAINCYNPSSTEICIKPSGSNVFNYKLVNTSSPSLFTLMASNGGLSYKISNSTNPEVANGIVYDGLILNLDSSDVVSYPGTGNTWYDLAGNGNSGIGTGFINAGSLIRLSSTDIVVNNSNTISGAVSTGNFTLETIVRATDLVYPRSAHPLFIGQNPTNSSTRGWSVGHGASTSSMQVRASNGTSLSVIDIPQVTTTNVFYHRVFTVDRSSGINTSFYVSGQLIGSATDATITGSIYPSYGLRFGDVWGWRFIGEVAAIRLYNKVLSPSEITQNYSAIKDKYGI